MFDYLGTFTELQLRERNAWLDTQIHALSASIEHLLAEADRLVRVVTTDADAGSRTTTTTYEQDSKVFNLSTTIIPKVVPNGLSMVAQIKVHAENSRYLLRVDPVSGDVSSSDSGWKPGARLPRVDSNTIEDVHGDDAVAAARMTHLLTPFRGVLKRQEYLEEKGKKARYRYMTLTDEIEEKSLMLENFASEVEAIDALLNNVTTITNSAGETETVSEYPTVGATNGEGKTGADDPGDWSHIQDLFEILAAPADVANPEDDLGDSSAVKDGPSIAENELDRAEVEAAIRAGGPGSISDFCAAFPSCNPRNGKGTSLKGDGTSRAIPTSHMQWLANIYAYGFESMEIVPEGPGLPLYRKNESVGQYLAKNAAEGLYQWAKDVQAVYPTMRIRITELWPPQQMHHSVGHFSGHSADVTFAIDSTKLVVGSDYGGSTLILEVVEYLCGLGVTNGRFSNYTNEYRVSTTYSTGGHIHINWEGASRKYLNVGALKNTNAVDPKLGSAPLK